VSSEQPVRQLRGHRQQCRRGPSAESSLRRARDPRQLGVLRQTRPHGARSARGGEEQASRYLETLQVACQRLVDSSALGRRCEHIRPGLWRRQAGRHILFFRRLATTSSFAGFYIIECCLSISLRGPSAESSLVDPTFLSAGERAFEAGPASGAGARGRPWGTSDGWTSPVERG
jgi:hypothetical protein